jgi:hypothetical protein
MPELDETQTSKMSRYRGGGTDMSKMLLPVLLGLIGSAAVGAFTFAWGTSKDVALLKAQQGVNPVEFARMQEQISTLKEKGGEIHAQHERELDQLRSWMRGHTHGVRLTIRENLPDEPPAAAAVPQQ